MTDAERFMANEVAGVAWWNSLSQHERAYWLSEAKSAVPADAWDEFQMRLTNAYRPITALSG